MRYRWLQPFALFLLIFSFMPLSVWAVNENQYYWTRELSNVEEIAQRHIAIAPSRDAVQITYKELIENARINELKDYLEVTASLLGLGAVIAAAAGGAMVIHEATALVMADTAMASGAALAVGSGILVEKLSKTAEKKLVSVATLAYEDRTEDTKIEDQLRHGIQSDVQSLKQSSTFFLERVKKLDETMTEELKEDRVQVPLVKYSLAKAIYGLALDIASEQPEEALHLLKLTHKLLDSIVRFDPKSSIAMVSMAQIDLYHYRVARQLGNTKAADYYWQQAKNDLDHALATEPKNHNIYISLANLYLVKQQNEQAIAILNQYLEHDWDYYGSRWRTLNVLGDAKRILGDLSGAVDAYEEANKLEENLYSLRWLVDLAMNPKSPECCVHLSKPLVQSQLLALLLTEIQDMDQQEYNMDDYYPWGSYLILHKKYYENLLKLATAIYFQQKNAEPLLQAVDFYNDYQKLTVGSPLHAETVNSFYQAVEDFNQHNPIKRTRLLSNGYWEATINIFRPSAWWGGWAY